MQMGVKGNATLFGVDYSTSDLDAVTRFWAYTAYVFGVSEEIVPQKSTEGVQLLDYILATHGEASRWSPDLAEASLNYENAIVDNIASPVGRWLTRMTLIPLVHGFTYFVSGDAL